MDCIGAIDGAQRGGEGGIWGRASHDSRDQKPCDLPGHPIFTLPRHSLLSHVPSLSSTDNPEDTDKNPNKRRGRAQLYLGLRHSFFFNDVIPPLTLDEALLKCRITVYPPRSPWSLLPR